jgi:hypothetical protein
LAQGTDPSRALLLVSFSALLVNSPTSIASVYVARIVSFWEMPPKHALALCKHKILRFWDLTVQRGWAHLVLGRFHDLVLSSGDLTAATREKDKPRTGIAISSMNAQGMAPLNLMASACGVAVVSTRRTQFKQENPIRCQV